MTGMRVSTAIALALLLTCSAAAPAGDPSSENALKAKGLTKVGLRYLLDADVNLRANLRAMRQARAQLDASLAKRAEIEKQIQAAYDAESQLATKFEDITTRMDQFKSSPVVYNDLLSQWEVARARMRDGDKYIADHQKALAAFVVPSDQYVSAVITLSDQLENAQAKYQTLAADPEVKASLARLTPALNVPVKLGPSEQFITELPSVRREREKVRSAVVKFDKQSGVPVVSVTLNGSLRQTMVVDSGASIVTLTYAVAKELGLTGAVAGPTLHLQVADGRSISAQLQVLQSVKLGQFTVENVECAVLPPGTPGDNLLGGTFLRHFVYRMDLDSGEIHLSQIGATASPKIPEPLPAKPQPNEPAPAADRSKWLNLLQTIDVRKDAIKGTWTFRQGGLEVAGGAAPAELRIRTNASMKYELHVEFQRTRMGDAFGVYLPLGDFETTLLLRPKQVGLDTIDGKRFDANETTDVIGLDDQRKHTLDIAVSRTASDARIICAIDGKASID